jgi:hypothetical protein
MNFILNPEDKKIEKLPTPNIKELIKKKYQG